MARRQIEILECDNPACGKSFEMGGDPVLGIHLSGGIIHEGTGGGSFDEVFACSNECLAPAVRHSYHRTITLDEYWHIPREK